MILSVFVSNANMAKLPQKVCPKFLFTQTTARRSEKHGAKTYAGGSREKYAVPTTLIFT